MILNTEKFYNLFTKEYGDYSKERFSYILSVNKIIKKKYSSPKKILDIGCGDGERIKQLSCFWNTKEIFLVDQSESMLNIAIKNTGFTGVKADIGKDVFFEDNFFDLITCLWNVLGHIENEERCLFALKSFKNKIDKNSGIIIFDINNRYNIFQYGLVNVIRNIIKDLYNYNFKNGDFLLSIPIVDKSLNTNVHIFNPFEMRRLIEKAGLVIEDEIYINYRTGVRVPSWLFGQILYIIKK